MILLSYYFARGWAMAQTRLPCICQVHPSRVYTTLVHPPGYTLPYTTLVVSTAVYSSCRPSAAGSALGSVL